MTGGPPSVRISGAAAIGGVRVFGPVDLTLDGGRWTCLLGPSGVGKTTVLRLVAGLDDAIAFDGRIEASDGAALPPRVALMSQDGALMPWLDAMGNVVLGARLRGERPDRERAEALLRQVGLAEHLTKRPAELSGGQRQRVALARTLIEDRPVVLLDEPFSALDARTRAEMQELAFGLLADRTVLLVTHEPGEAARLGHRIVVMTESGFREVAPPDAAPPRPVAGQATLDAQARLLAELRVPA